jgi:glucose-1-phosphate adenylyltransferase
MDLLGEKPVLSLHDESWRIYSRQMSSTPQYIGDGATVINSSVTAGCEIYGTVKNSVLSNDVTVEEGAIVEDSVLLGGVTVKAGAVVRYAILDTGVTVGAGAAVGEDKATASGIAVIGANYAVADGDVVPAGAMISDN